MLINTYVFSVIYLSIEMIDMQLTRSQLKVDHLGGGFPHSEIAGSKGALASPALIAECHVLHRLLPPRHPPDALLTLDLIFETHVQR